MRTRGYENITGTLALNCAVRPCALAVRDITDGFMLRISLTTVTPCYPNWKKYAVSTRVLAFGRCNGVLNGRMPATGRYIVYARKTA